jgi:mannose-6-phosphate isomerase-like protein (cupin superfamily)
MFPSILPHVKLVRVARMFVRPGEGEAVTRAGTRALDILCDLPELSAVLIRHAAGEPGPDLHVHREHTDAFYVLEGTLTVELGPGGAESFDLAPGSLALAPANVVHTFRNGGDDWLSILNLHAPGDGFNAMLRGARDGVAVPWDSFAPPADGGRAAVDGVVSRPGEGEPLDAGDNRFLFKAQATDGDGTVSVTEMTVGPGFPGPPPHLHRGFAECFYVLEGTLGLRLGEDAVEAEPGTFASAPPGTPHTFSNPGSEPVRVINLIAPGGFEAYIKELWASGRPPDPATIARIGPRCDIEVV